MMHDLRIKLLLVAACGVIGACATPANYSLEEPLTADDSASLVVIHAPGSVVLNDADLAVPNARALQQRIESLPPLYEITVSRIGSSGDRLNIGESRVLQFYTTSDPYAVVRVPEGEYGMRAIRRVGSGTLVCFGGDTVTFDVEPGTVSFLGTLPQEEVADTYASYRGVGDEFSQPLRYELLPADVSFPAPRHTEQSSVEKLGAFLSREYPGVTAPVKQVNATVKTLRANTDMFGKPTCS